METERMMRWNIEGKGVTDILEYIFLKTTDKGTVDKAVSKRKNENKYPSYLKRSIIILLYFYFIYYIITFE